MHTRVVFLLVVKLTRLGIQLAERQKFAGLQVVPANCEVQRTAASFHARSGGPEDVVARQLMSVHASRTGAL